MQPIPPRAYLSDGRLAASNTTRFAAETGSVSLEEWSAARCSSCIDESIS